jgi:hypothetical protein
MRNHCRPCCAKIVCAALCFFVNQTGRKTMKITGTYQSDGVFGTTVRIFRAEGVWETTFGEAPRIPAFTQEYAVDFGSGLVGQGHFDGKVLRGGLYPISHAVFWVNGTPVQMKTQPTQFWTGVFEATVRDDGSFNVVIKRWDGKAPGKDTQGSQITWIGENTQSGSFEPDYEVVQDVWHKPLV